MIKVDWQMMQWAAGYYLSEPLPSKGVWMSMDEDDRQDFLEYHAWIPFENWEADRISELIEDLATDVQRMKETNK